LNSGHNQIPRQILSVSKLTENIKLLLEKTFPMVWICGEISNLRIPSSGHAYFTLKDDSAQIAAVMFRGQVHNLKFALDDGLTIIGLGRITVYEPRGNYQIILEYAEPKGAGALQLAFEQLKRKLELEGLFDPSRKRPLPFLPGTIAVITSPTGAVIRDILHVVNRRFPNVRLEVWPVRVQGDAAAFEIARALDNANVRARADVIILARGGGSLEDLAAFNTELVARAIHASAIPVVSAVGHETDFTIADFVADVRAPTPSAAAELVVPVKAELRERCTALYQRGSRAMRQMVAGYRDKAANLQRALVHPAKRVQENQLRVDDWSDRLQRAMRMAIQRQQSASVQLQHRLMRCNPGEQVRSHGRNLALLQFKALNSFQKIVGRGKQRLASCQASLMALSPRAVLRRGYSITRTIDAQHIVIESKSVHIDQMLEVLLAKGRLQVKVVTSDG